MDAKITPFLWFDSQAEEAAEFYVSVFPGSKIVEVVRGSTVPGAEEQVMTVAFELAGKPFTALNGGPQYTFTEAVSFVIHCDDQAEIDHYWDALTAAGGEEGPCGWLKDRFGLSWQVVPEAMLRLLKDADRERAGRAMQAMLRMKKLDIAELERAAASVPA
jgi:predicted 3-demethylubiquinone-9 3-methyltransferase (glyoxalase superfamily)